MKRDSYKSANAANKKALEDAQVKLAREADGTQTVTMTLDEATAVHEAMVEARHLLDRVVDPLLGGGCGALHPVTKVGRALTKAERLIRNAMMRRGKTPDQLDDEASYEGKFYSTRRLKSYPTRPPRSG